MRRWYLTASLALGAFGALLLPTLRAHGPVTTPPLPPSPAGEVPVGRAARVVLLDTSGSMVGASREEVQAWVSTSTRPEDLLGLVTFADEAHSYGWYGGAQRENLATLIETAPVGGGSNLAAGVETALEMFPGYGGELWIVSDGDPNVGALDLESFEGLAREARSRNVTVHRLGTYATPYLIASLEAATR